MIGWARQNASAKAHVVTETRPLTDAKGFRIGTQFRSVCPHDVDHHFERDDYEWMPWLWQPTPDEACWLCWRRIARLGGFEYPI